MTDGGSEYKAGFKTFLEDNAIRHMVLGRNSVGRYLCEVPHHHTVKRLDRMMQIAMAELKSMNFNLDDRHDLFMLAANVTAGLMPCTNDPTRTRLEVETSTTLTADDVSRIVPTYPGALVAVLDVNAKQPGRIGNKTKPSWVLGIYIAASLVDVYMNPASVTIHIILIPGQPKPSLVNRADFHVQTNTKFDIVPPIIQFLPDEDAPIAQYLSKGIAELAASIGLNQTIDLTVRTAEDEPADPGDNFPRPQLTVDGTTPEFEHAITEIDSMSHKHANTMARLPHERVPTQLRDVFLHHLNQSEEIQTEEFQTEEIQTEENDQALSTIYEEDEYEINIDDQIEAEERDTATRTTDNDSDDDEYEINIDDQIEEEKRTRTISNKNQRSTIDEYETENEEIQNEEIQTEEDDEDYHPFEESTTNSKATPAKRRSTRRRTKTQQYMYAIGPTPSERTARKRLPRPRKGRLAQRKVDTKEINISASDSIESVLAEMRRPDKNVVAYFASREQPTIGTPPKEEGSPRQKDHLPYSDTLDDVEDDDLAYFTANENSDDYDSEQEFITEMETALGNVSVPLRTNRTQRRAAERERHKLESKANQEEDADLLSVVSFAYMLAALGATATQASDNSGQAKAGRLKADQVQLPKNSRAARKSPQSAQWFEAEEYEIDKHRQHGVFTEMKLGDARRRYGFKRVQDSEFVYKAKPDAFGYVYRWRARLVCKAYNMREGFEYFEKFAAVPKHYTWKLLLAIAATLGLEIKLLDVESAFLNSELTEDEYVFVRLPGDPVYQPDTPKAEKRKGSNWETIQVATKALNGSPASPRAWKKKLNHTLRTNAKFKFTQSRVDPCLWIGRTREQDDSAAAFSILMVVWVDDLLVVSWRPRFMTDFIETIKTAFPITQSDLDLYLSMSITHDKEQGIIDCQQNELIQSTATALGLDRHSRSRETPQEPKVKMTKADCPTTAAQKEDQKEFNTLYRTGVGVALWISGMTRNDSKHAVAQLSRFVSNPGRPHWNALLSLYRYWLNTPEVTLRFARETNADLVTNKPAVPQFVLRAASDASWGSEDDSSFYCGWALIWCGCVLLAKSKKWPSAAISSCEAEIIAMSECARDVRPTRWMLEEVGYRQRKPTVLWSDSSSAIINAEEPERSSDRTKHIRIRDWFIRECVALGEILPVKAETNYLCVDALTKALARVKVQLFRPFLQGWAIIKDSVGT